MENSLKPKPLFWVIAIVALLWNVMGVISYLGQKLMTPEMLGKLPQEQQDMYNQMPMWATAAFAIAVWGGLAASISMVVRKKWANQLFILSFVGIVVQMVYNVFISNALEVYGPGGLVMPVMILAFGLLFIFYSKHAIKKGWLS